MTSNVFRDAVTCRTHFIKKCFNPTDRIKGLITKLYIFWPLSSLSPSLNSSNFNCSQDSQLTSSQKP